MTSDRVKAVLPRSSPGAAISGSFFFSQLRGLHPTRGEQAAEPWGQLTPGGVDPGGVDPGVHEPELAALAKEWKWHRSARPKESPKATFLAPRRGAGRQASVSGCFQATAAGRGRTESDPGIALRAPLRRLRRLGKFGCFRQLAFLGAAPLDVVRWFVGKHRRESIQLTPYLVSQRHSAQFTFKVSQQDPSNRS